jgi:hypothetical protein
MLPPAFLAQLAHAARPTPVAAVPRPGPPRPHAPFARWATIRACRGRWPIGRVAGWTLGWTVFQWWAVIGWPYALERSPAALILGGVATLVGLAVWRDVREPRLPEPSLKPPGRVQPLPPPRGATGPAAEAGEDDSLAA